MQRRASGIQVHAGGALHNGTVGPQGVGRVGAAGDSAVLTDAKLGGTRKPPQLPKATAGSDGHDRGGTEHLPPVHSGGGVSSYSLSTSLTNRHGP